ncbi:zinc finger protein 37 homolog isoform X16 [Manduca sexta]|uniref:zinc finger protein 37 homolog isoform X16 n=1 Tax=Manduca sexta TaxID=7130 RepID=UPI00188E6A61|nr:zinc finger protein 37 homolog isoform X16 [Manduca sexta]
MDGKTSDWRPGPSVCRCCLAEGCYKDISTEYFWMGKREVYADMLSDTFSVSIAYSSAGGPNSHSRLICEPCISRLRDAADFKRQVQECERTFMQHLDPGSTSAANDIDIEAQPAGKEVKLEQVKLEKRFSDDDFDTADFGDEDDDDMDDQPLTKFATKVPKKEAVDFLDLIDNSQITVKRMSMSKSKAPPAKKVKVTKKEPAKPTASKAPIKVVKEKKKKGSVQPTLLCRFKKKYKDHRQNAAIIIQNSNACPFRWTPGKYKCAYCDLTFGDCHGVRLHWSDHPNKIEFLKYARGYYKTKVEVTNLKCELCMQSMSNLETLGDHLIEFHDKPIKKDCGLGLTPFVIKDDSYICGYCNDSFVVFSALNVHMNTHNPNFICSTCGKVFATLQNLKSHVVKHDVNWDLKCGKCDEIFATKDLKHAHNMSKHAVSHPYKCPYCNETFKNYNHRRLHLERNHDKKVEYRCSLCPAVFAMSDRRRKHVRDVHIKQKTFLCSYCSQKFVTADSMRKHLQTHTSERDYRCEACSKSYKKYESLKHHMKIHSNKFVCEVCDEDFSQRIALVSHLKSQHPDVKK